MVARAPFPSRREALRVMSDREVLQACEAASEAYDEPAMHAAADQMQRRDLDH